MFKNTGLERAAPASCSDLPLEARSREVSAVFMYSEGRVAALKVKLSLYISATRQSSFQNAYFTPPSIMPLCAFSAFKPSTTQPLWERVALGGT